MDTANRHQFPLGTHSHFPGATFEGFEPRRVEIRLAESLSLQAPAHQRGAYKNTHRNSWRGPLPDLVLMRAIPGGVETPAKPYGPGDSTVGDLHHQYRSAA